MSLSTRHIEFSQREKHKNCWGQFNVINAVCNITSLPWKMFNVQIKVEQWTKKCCNKKIFLNVPQDHREMLFFFFGFWGGYLPQAHREMHFIFFGFWGGYPRGSVLAHRLEFELSST